MSNPYTYSIVYCNNSTYQCCKHYIKYYRYCLSYITHWNYYLLFNKMKKFILLIVASYMMLIGTSCESVGVGYEGVKINYYGSDKGVDSVSLSTGAQWYNPLTQNIVQYPVFVQTVDYEPFTINAQGGSEFIIDPTVSLKIEDGKSPKVYEKYQKTLDEVIHITIYNYVKDAYRTQLNKFSTDYIISHRDSIENAIESYLSESLKREHFKLEQLTSGLQYPQSIVDAVTAKTRAVQDAQRVQNELEVVKAEAEKVLVKARAEKEANELKSQALTPQILQQQWIEKWNGNVPTVTSETSGTFINLSDLK